MKKLSRGCLPPKFPEYLREEEAAIDHKTGLYNGGRSAKAVYIDNDSFRATATFRLPPDMPEALKEQKRTILLAQGLKEEPQKKAAARKQPEEILEGAGISLDDLF